MTDNLAYDQSAAAARERALQDRVQVLEARLEALMGGTFLVPGLTATENNVLRVLYVTNGVATKERIFQALYGQRIDGGPEPKIIDVLICKIRKKLAAYDVEISTVWGTGYQLGDKARKKLSVFDVKPVEAAA